MEARMNNQANAGGASVDEAEVGRFARLAQDWWNPRGSMRALHRLNPLRLRYIRSRIAERYDRSATAVNGLEGLSIVDIGCGAGLLCEPLARLGARMVGVDAAAASIEVARHHGEEAGLSIDYRCTSAEAIEAASERFDVVLAMEVVEHVVEPQAFIATCAGLLNPGGLLIVSTINRTRRAFALAILTAEHVLGWVPKGTHQWEKFVKPEELEAAGSVAGLATIDLTGVVYLPILDEWRLSRDVAVNYMTTLAA